MVVDLVAILAAPLFGLIGVWLGGELQSRKEAQRLAHQERLDREVRAEAVEQARETRLFDHKREAYTALLEEQERLSMSQWRRTRDPAAEPPPDDETRAHFIRAVAVQIYGSERAASAAVNVNRKLTDWIHSSPAQEREKFWIAEVSVLELMNAVREDLGVGGELPPDIPVEPHTPSPR